MSGNCFISQILSRDFLFPFSDSRFFSVLRWSCRVIFALLILSGDFYFSLILSFFCSHLLSGNIFYAFRRFCLKILSSAKCGPVTAYYLHANVWATSQHTFECQHVQTNVVSWLKHSRVSNRPLPVPLLAELRIFKQDLLKA